MTRQNELSCVVLGYYSHLKRSYRHLNSSENMKARLVRLVVIPHINVLNLNGQ